jgi:hypothetical protein
MITKTCEICGSAYQVKPYRANKARFCSQQCGGKWHMSVRAMPNDHKVGNKWRAGQPPENAFHAGHAPWNRGLKGIRLSPETEFKKGQRSHKRMPVGTVSIRPDKNGVPRAFVKIADPNSWRLRAVVVWEGENGPVPPGKVIHHKDRDSLNDAPSNLDALTRKEHIAEHRRDFHRAKSP